MPDSRLIRVQDPLPDVLPKRRKGLEVAEFGTELVVLATHSKQAHHLQGLASIVFDACDGRTRSEELAQQVAQSTGCELREARSAIGEIWRTFVRAGLVEVQPRSKR